MRANRLDYRAERQHRRDRSSDVVLFSDSWSRSRKRLRATGHSLRTVSTRCAATANKFARTPVRGLLVDVGPLVIPHARAAKLIEPGKRPLDDPAPPTQSTPVRSATHREPRDDMPRPRSAANRRRVLTAIPEHTVRPLPRSPPSAMQRGNPIHEREGFLRVVPVRASQANGTPRPSQIRWRLLPRLPRSVGFGPVWSPPQTARMEQLSTTARDQSIWSERASQSKSAKWIKSHTPACCQSRSAASTSSPTRTRVPAGASARECRFRGQRECR